MEYDVDAFTNGIIGGAMIFMIIIMLLVLVLVIIETIALWNLFKKAGKPGWASIVPFYSTWMLIEISGLNWWWFLIIVANSFISAFEIDVLTSIASIASLVASFNCYYNISKKFNKDNTFAVFAGIFNVIFLLVLGLSKKNVYNNDISVSPNGVFGKSDANNNFNNYNNNNYNNNNYNMNNTYNDNNMYPQNNNSVINEQANNNESVSFCGNCGTKLNSNTRFCPNCGTEKR